MCQYSFLPYFLTGTGVHCTSMGHTIATWSNLNHIWTHCRSRGRRGGARLLIFPEGGIISCDQTLRSANSEFVRKIRPFRTVCCFRRPPSVDFGALKMRIWRHKLDILEMSLPFFSLRASSSCFRFDYHKCISPPSSPCARNDDTCWFQWFRFHADMYAYISTSWPQYINCKM